MIAKRNAIAPDAASGGAIVRSVWGKGVYDEFVEAIHDETLLWPNVKRLVTGYLNDSGSAIQAAVEAEASDKAAELAVRKADMEKLVAGQKPGIEKLTAEVEKCGYASLGFALFLLAVFALHIFGEWVLNIDVIPFLAGSEGTAGLALALTASLAPLALEKVLGANTGPEPWNPHGEAKGWRRVFLWCLGILNCVSLFFVASCRSVMAFYRVNPDVTLSAAQQQLIDNALLVLSCTIALNASVFALYFFAEFREWNRQSKLRKELWKAKSEFWEVEEKMRGIAESEVRAKARQARIRQEANLQAKEFIAQRLLRLEARIAAIATSKDPRAMTTLVEQMKFSEAILPCLPPESEAERSEFGEHDDPNCACGVGDSRNHLVATVPAGS